MSFRRRRRRNDSDSSSASADSRQMMNLALFIMLLAFFIVLNTLSSYEEIKTEQVRRSVELAFSNDPSLKDTSPSVKPDPAKSMKEGHTFDRLEALFEAQIVSFEATQSKSRGMMMVRVPYEKFSTAIMALDQKDLTRYPSRRAIQGNFFLPTLVSILRANIDGAPTRMEIVAHADENPAELQNQAPAELNKIIDNVGAFSRKLSDQGMPQKLVNIGIAEGDPAYIDLVFRKYVPFSPAGEEEES
jgi:hypothetical protein